MKNAMYLFMLLHALCQHCLTFSTFRLHCTWHLHVSPKEVELSVGIWLQSRLGGLCRRHTLPQSSTPFYFERVLNFKGHEEYMKPLAKKRNHQWIQLNQTNNILFVLKRHFEGHGLPQNSYLKFEMFRTFFSLQLLRSQSFIAMRASRASR